VKIVYELSCERPHEHVANVVVRITENDQPQVDLVLPSWVPGSYWIQNQAKFLRRFSASASEDGRSLPVERVDKGRWRIGTGSVAGVEARYEIYGHDLRTESVDVNSDHLFLTGILAFPYVDGAKDLPCEVVLHLPPGWKVFTELKEIGKNPPRFRAENYDVLVDSPIDCGHPAELTLMASGIPHRIVLCGEGGNAEPHRLEADVTRFVETTIRLFGDSPLEHYTFFLHLTDEPDGGLEHLTSNSAVVSRNTFRPKSSYQRLLVLLCHEYFHLYNVKRIRPKVLGPFDYTKEVYTHLLWLMEGTTDYYAYLLLRRAQLRPAKHYLEKLGERIQRYLAIPGRAVRSLEESSFLSWIDLYLPYEDSRNQSVSYYTKGDLVSLALDLEIRHRTEDHHSLDDVMRHLWRNYGKLGRGLEEHEMPGIVQAETGVDVSDFFRRYVEGTEEIDFARFLRYAGIKFHPKEPKPEPGDDEEAGYLGVEFTDDAGRPKIRSVLDGGPARRAGLSPGDEIVALNGARVTFSEFEKSLKRFPAGSTIEVSLFRRGWLTRLPLVTGKAPPEKYLLTPIETPSPLERGIYESWLDAKWEAPKKADDAAADQ
jgi:predicted metalloprotease with PDZ domain